MSPQRQINIAIIRFERAAKKIDFWKKFVTREPIVTDDELQQMKQMFESGMSCKDIAAEMYLSSVTVKTYLDKEKAPSTTAMAKRAHENH